MKTTLPPPVVDLSRLEGYDGYVLQFQMPPGVTLAHGYCHRGADIRTVSEKGMGPHFLAATPLQWSGQGWKGARR